MNIMCPKYSWSLIWVKQLAELELGMCDQLIEEIENVQFASQIGCWRLK